MQLINAFIVGSVVQYHHTVQAISGLEAEFGSGTLNAMRCLIPIKTLRCVAFLL